MKKYYVLDTNACRNIVYGCDRKVMYDDKLHGNIFFPVITAMELLRHLRLEDRAFSECKKALCLLLDNAITVGNAIESLEFIPDMFTLLKNYFSVSDKNYTLIDTIINVSREITNEGSVKNLSEEIAKINDYYDGLIQTMIDNTQNYLNSLYGNNGTSWTYIIENSEIRKDFIKKLESGLFHKNIALALIYAVIPQSEVKGKVNDETVEKFQSDFAVSIDFFVRKILGKLISSPEAIDKLSNKEKDRKNKRPKWNSFYDMQLIAGIEYCNCEGSEVKAIFVTNEKDIIKFFENAGKGELVLKLEDYIGESTFKNK